ncbi:MAG: DNA adenine methylase, partial [Candidatus Hydrothermarchaeales archaeon]
RFLYLNKTCYNGLYRVNSKGKFNVPMGRYKNPSILMEDKLKEASELLQGVTIKLQDFWGVLNDANKRDFVYFDPPYYPLSSTANFTGYTPHNFLEEEQTRLADVYRKLNKKGCLLMESNSDTKLINELYEGFKKEIVKARRMINSDATKRGAINEVLILNYEEDSDV